MTMVTCQLFLGMGATGGSRNFQSRRSAYENDKTFGVHPIEKILMEETGISSPEEAKVKYNYRCFFSGIRYFISGASKI